MTGNSNPQFDRRMRHILRESTSDDITFQHINNREEMLKHDLLKQHIQQQKDQRAISAPTRWQSRKDRQVAEQRKTTTVYHFQAVSGSGTKSAGITSSQHLRTTTTITPPWMYLHHMNSKRGHRRGSSIHGLFSY